MSDTPTTHVAPDGSTHPGGRIDYCDAQECADWTEAYDNDDTRVRCDWYCAAPTNPKGEVELEHAYEHWRHHEVTGGCSHGN